MITFVHSFQSEWLKKRRSAAFWLVILGGFFIPAIILISRLVQFDELAAANASNHIWEVLYQRSWQFMAILLLPMGVILATSLVTQLEFRNNGWKQLHTTPQRLTTVYFAKLLVIVLMLLQFFILFNAGVYLVGVIPSVFRSVPYPNEPFPWRTFLRGDGRWFVDCLPIVALQYLISLQFRNFLVPIGAGLAIYVGSMMGMFWKYGYVLPYAYCAVNFLHNNVKVDRTADIQHWAIGYFVLFSIGSYILYITKREKG